MNEEIQPGEFSLPAKEYMAVVGNRLKTIRRRLGMTQKEAARSAGMSQPFLSAIERGQKTAGTSQIVGLIRLYRVPYETIFGELEQDELAIPQVPVKAALGYELLEQLIGEANSRELAQGAADCINVCAYIVFRSVYRLNPHNSERPFSLDFDEALRAAEHVITSAPDLITRFIGSDRDISVTSFELPTERNEDIRAFIRDSEGLLRKTLERMG